MEFHLLLLLLLLSLRSGASTLPKERCLPGNNHKKVPGAENSDYKACRSFQNNTCCTANFTNQLAVPVIHKVDAFSWTLCGNLSERCQDFMVAVECFYRCSPNVAYWEDEKEVQAFKDAPVCSHFCDAWFEACREDMTCAKNWIKDFNISRSDYSNSCKATSPCRKFSDVYEGGRDLCESMWDDSFKYTTAAPCLRFNFSGPENPNNDVVRRIFLNGASSRGLVQILVGCSFIAPLIADMLMA